MARGVLKVATCQFAVGSSIDRNARQIHDLMNKAAAAGAQIVHFPECALSGYAGVDLDTTEDIDWQKLRQETEKIMQLAGRLKLYVVLGSTHRLTPPNRPHNSLYLIGPDGALLDRYDKRFCMSRDLLYYTPGSRFVTFVVNGVTCALLICFDARFPELYRELYKRKVNLILQSFYNARQKGPSIHTRIIRQTMQAHAAINYFWISMANAGGYLSPYPSCFIQPDGIIARSLRPSRPGIMINTVDLKQQFYDPMAPFRDLPIRGKLTNAPKIIRDPRSTNTKSL